MQHLTPVFHASDAIAPILFPVVYIALSSLIKEPNRRHFNAIMIGGAGRRLSQWRRLGQVGIPVHCGGHVLRLQGAGIVPIYRNRVDAARGMGSDASFLWQSDRAICADLVGGVRDHRYFARDLVLCGCA